MTPREQQTLAALATLRDAILRLTPQIPLKTLNELQEPMQAANTAIRAYRAEIRADIEDTRERSFNAPYPSVTVSKY